jgi:hypothetical protein
VTPLEARAALETIERGRLRVIDEIDLPSWYWWGVALGWIGLVSSSSRVSPSRARSRRLPMALATRSPSPASSSR